LVHGVPETAAVWDGLRAELHRDDVIALQLPGFGCPRPEGFAATKEAYVAWLIGELEQLERDGPIDLVGHDWGGGFVLRAVSTRSDLVRSWLTDIAGMGDVDFEWHAVAKIWQTPGAGEDFFTATFTQTPEERGPLYADGFNIPLDAAIAMNRAMDETMGGCILDLYRSAVDVGIEWAPAFRDIPKPGCVLVAGDDPFLSPELARRATARAGATLTELDGVSHFWMLQDPARSAAAIEAIWSTLESGAERRPGR
jgi:pimeloyl-ACP methyl ester carboxylesterase